MRFLAAASLLVMAIVAGAAFDLSPSSPGYSTGTIAATAVHAPTSAAIPNEVETQQQRDASAAAQPFLYDYTAAIAANRADAQVASFQVALSPLDSIFSTTKAADL